MSISTEQVKQDMKAFGICVVMPTFNNDATLGCVIEDLLPYCSDIIVVNDGSTDSTLSILDSYKDKISVVSYKRNRGKGYALKVGFNYALNSGFSYAVTIDSDGQHLASDLPLFVKAVIENPDSLIIGSRDLTRVDINGKSSFANKFSNFWFHLQTGKRLSDTQTGYRAYPLENLYGLNLLTSRYEAELELLVFAAWHDVNIVSIPINVYYPPREERISHFRPALDFTRISILNTFLCIAAIFYALPLYCLNLVRHKKPFNFEFKPFTRHKGEKMDVATTFARFVRTIYGFSLFSVPAIIFVTPMAYLLKLIPWMNHNTRADKFHRLLRKSLSFVVKIYPGCKTHFKDFEDITFNRPVVMVCNHQSNLDLPVLLSLSPKLIFLTNDHVWNHPVYGAIVRQAEFLSVSDGIESMLPRLKNLVARGYSVVIFPEGTRSADSKVRRFHQGAFLLAKELNLDILPVVIHGAGFFLPKGKPLFRKNDIVVKALSPIKQANLVDLSPREAASICRKLIAAELTRLDDEVQDYRYFRAFLFYKYAYRGWKTVSRCKDTLRALDCKEEMLLCNLQSDKTIILNSGIGTYAILYALLHPATEVLAYENSVHDYNIAASTPDLPANLKFLHYSSVSELDNDADLALILNANEAPMMNNLTSKIILLNLKS